MKGTGDHGSKLPLNIGQRKLVAEEVKKSDTALEKAIREARNGTPPTRWGTFNGVVPATKPALSGPALVLKAVRDPALANTGMMDKTPRKRGADGKFATTQAAGPQSTATDDLANREREAQLAAKRYLKALGFGEEQESSPSGPPMAGGGAGSPSPAAGAAPDTSIMPPNNGTPAPAPPAGGAAGGSAAAGPAPQGGSPAPGQPPQAPGPQLAKPQDPMAQAGVAGVGAGSGPPGQGVAPGMGQAGSQDPMMSMAPPIGQTPEGMPIYDDPYNPAHQSFTPDQHRAAAQVHNQQAEMMTSSGRIPDALDQQMKAQIHLDLANDAQSPMERMMSRQQGGGMNPMDQFLNQMGQQPGAQNVDQNKPIGAQPDAGPLPGMMNTHTGGNVGPQSQSGGHAGTMEQPQGMPPDPTGSSMPDIAGQPGTTSDPFDYSPDMFADDDLDQSGEEAQGGMGAQGAPPTHGGAPTQVGPDEAAMTPAPGGESSDPALTGAGPSTDDTSPTAGPNINDTAAGDDGDGDFDFDLAAMADGQGGDDAVPDMANAGGADQDIPPFGGDPTEDKAAEGDKKHENKPPAAKSFENWFKSI